MTEFISVSFHSPIGNGDYTRYKIDDLEHEFSFSSIHCHSSSTNCLQVHKFLFPQFYFKLFRISNSNRYILDEWAESDTFVIGSNDSSGPTFWFLFEKTKMASQGLSQSKFA